MRYEKLEKIGQGSFGKIYRVRQLSSGEELVMKKIDLSSVSKKARKDAETETKILKSLEHPNIIKFYDSFMDKNKLCIITEYCEAGDLSRKIKRATGPLAEDEVLDIFIQICLGVEYLHRKNILHRDIKAMNVFLHSNGGVKIGDMGVAKIVSDVSQFVKSVVGTPFYLSPELCLEKPYNHKSDVWSLGCLLYELCARAPPFKESRTAELYAAIAASEPPPLPLVYSADLRNLVSKLLRKDFRERPSLEKILNLPFIQGKMKQFGRVSNSFTLRINSLKDKLPNEGIEDPPPPPPPRRPRTLVLTEKKACRTIGKIFREKTPEIERNYRSQGRPLRANSTNADPSRRITLHRNQDWTLPGFPEEHRPSRPIHPEYIAEEPPESPPGVRNTRSTPLCGPLNALVSARAPDSFLEPPFSPSANSNQADTYNLPPPHPPTPQPPNPSTPLFHSNSNLLDLSSRINCPKKLKRLDHLISSHRSLTNRLTSSLGASVFLSTHAKIIEAVQNPPEDVDLSPFEDRDLRELWQRLLYTEYRLNQEFS